MDLNNVKLGVKKLYIAAILELISELIAGALMLIPEESEWLAVSLSVSAVSLSILLVSGFLDVYGLKTAGKDEPHFKAPLPIVFAMIILCVIEVVLGFVEISFEIEITAGHIVSVLDIAIAVFVCLNVSRLFEKKGNEEMAKEGISVAIIHIIIFAVTKGIEIFVELNRENDVWLPVIGIILAVVYYGLTIFGHMELIRYLGHAKKGL